MYTFNIQASIRSNCPVEPNEYVMVQCDVCGDFHDESYMNKRDNITVCNECLHTCELCGNEHYGDDIKKLNRMWVCTDCLYSKDNDFTEIL